MKNFIIGIVVGIGNIVPGLSGSALLIIFGLYKKCLKAIANILKDFKKNFLFLLPIGLGIIVGTVLFSRIISFFFDKYIVATSFIFVGFIIGTLPKLFAEAQTKKFAKSNLIPLIITFIIGISMLFITKNNSVYINEISINGFLISILMGGVLSCATIIPGISATVLLSMFGFYSIYLNAIANLNIIVLIPLIIGFSITSFFLSKLITVLLNKYHDKTFYAIIGFVIATIPALLKINIVFNLELIIGITLGVVACFITYIIEKLVDN